jgi:hypothetical protein
MVLFRNWSGITIEVFTTPTREPEIRILEKPQDFTVTAGFGGDDRLRHTGITDRYILDGVYFPPAVMKIRWYPKVA